MQGETHVSPREIEVVLGNQLNVQNGSPRMNESLSHLARRADTWGRTLRMRIAGFKKRSYFCCHEKQETTRNVSEVGGTVGLPTVVDSDFRTMQNV